MKLARPFLMVVIALAVGLAAADQGAGPVADASQHTRYVFGLSPFLADASKDEIYRQIVRFVLEGMPQDSSLWLYDAYAIRTITQVDIPTARAFRSAKTRANQFRERIQELRRFLATSHPRPQSPGLTFDQAVRLPQFLDFVGDNLTGPGHAVVVVVLGSPLYQDDKEPGFSMVNGYFPSDGHLLATRERSVFGRKDRPDTLKGIAVHLGYSGDPWVSEVHRDRILRFWTLFVAQQGGRLATFTGDLPTVFNALRARADMTEAPPRKYELDPTQTKVEMLRITREVGVADWITRDLPAEAPPPPPSVTTGPMKIGIRWRGRLDLDLYARPTHQGETLYFEHTRSAEGYYFKDHRTAPEREYEFIEFLTPVDVWQAEAYVNFYAGDAPGGPEGEVRVEFEGRIYTGRFALAATHGNEGRAGGGQARFWTPLDLPKILRLK